MSNAFMGQIVLFAGTFAPKNWAFCSGQSLSIQQNAALFSILGTTYGGDGVQTFNLPDLRGRVAVSQGQGPGLSAYTLGQQSGQENVTLTVQQMPQHNHLVSVSNVAGSQPLPSNNFLAGSSGRIDTFATAGNATLNQNSLTQVGGNQGHTNIQPVLALNYIICLFGIFPSRN